jgi:FkbH-like protein
MNDQSQPPEAVDSDQSRDREEAVSDQSRDREEAVPARAAAILAELNAQPTVVNITRASRLLRPQRDALATVSLRVACLSSFTFDPIVPALEMQGLRSGFGFETYLGPFGQFEQELIDPSSGLASFRPDFLLLAVRLQDVCPPIYDSFNSLTADDAARLIDDWIGRLRSALTVFRGRCGAHVLVQSYDLPAWPALGIADRTSSPSQAGTIARANEALSALAASVENVQVMDYDALVARHGRESWHDPRLALYARIPLAAEHYWHLAGFYVQHLRPLYGLTRKVLVLDADNTLWGGVVGDVGLDNIALGHDYPGNAYLAFQKRILDLSQRGVILCLASKNEPGTVEEVFAKHPDMVLRSAHFSARRVNWNSKPDNLQQMAADLNLGLESFVFVDDSAVECELMRAAWPEVLTILLPADPAQFPGVIESLDCFDQWTVSAEDRQRGKLYQAEARRTEVRAATVDMPAFYRRLGMKMTVFEDHQAHVGRAAQMTNRTNQFNMHTIRCSEDDLRRFMASDEHKVFTVALQDRFGDNGVVGLAVVCPGPEQWVLHMFLMSCRVLGRTVEQTFVGWIAQQARAAGAQRLVAEFLPTAKNKPFAGFYQERGFVEAQAGGDIQRWNWEIEGADTDAPEWIELEVAGPAAG